MRRAALIVLLLTAGCGSSESEESGSCAAAVAWDGMIYLGTSIDAGKGLRSAELIEDEFVLPGCNDGGGHEPDRTTSVFAIRGVPPELAVIDGGSLYLNTGYFTELRDHPLHELLGRDRRRRARGKPCTVEGSVGPTVWQKTVRTDRGEMDLVVDARTEIEGLDRAGHPYVEEGQELRIEGRCRGDLVLARSIEPLA
jgi:hypothetical protein